MATALEPPDQDGEIGTVRGLHGYVRQVAAALGLSGDCYYVENAPPRSAYLALEGRLPGCPDQHVALLWDECHGWALVTETEAAAELVPRGYFGESVLPCPGRVAEFSVEIFTGKSPSHTAAPRLRELGSKDGLSEWLASYDAHETNSQPANHGDQIWPW
jgi:hypothetical protein